MPLHHKVYKQEVAAVKETQALAGSAVTNMTTSDKVSSVDLEVPEDEFDDTEGNGFITKSDSQKTPEISRRRNLRRSNPGRTSSHRLPEGKGPKPESRSKSFSVKDGHRSVAEDFITFASLMNGGSSAEASSDMTPESTDEEEEAQLDQLNERASRNVARRQLTARNSFRRRRFSRALSGFTIETSLQALKEGSGRGSQLTLSSDDSRDSGEKAELIDSVRWLGQHMGESVLLSLIEQTEHEGGHFMEQLDASMSAMEKFTPEDIISGQACTKLGIVEKRQTQLLNSIASGGPLDDDSVKAGLDDFLPKGVKHQSAVLFVDISGFTKLSTTLGVELLSKTINLYFQMIIREVEAYGGDVVRYAGDALIAEWQAVPSSEILDGRSLAKRSPGIGLRRKHKVDKSVLVKTALCAANIVDKCSNYPVYNESGTKVATLNVYCGVGFGRCIGIHVGDSRRKEYLLLGSPLKQVAQCIDAASAGDVVISPTALALMEELVIFDSDFTAEEADLPTVIASKSQRRFKPRDEIDVEARGSRLRRKIDQKLAECNNLALKRLQELAALYVHPSAVQDEASTRNQRRSKRRNKAKAELRGVFTLFICPKINVDLTGAGAEDVQILRLLNKVMLNVNSQLAKFGGQLRQYILDDKGLVLIANFGLRGSTFPDMIERRAIPCAVIIQTMMKIELGLECRMGATYGNAYCGVVGGVRRHEYAVLGPSVNLAARLMVHPMNRGFLVDEGVRQKAGQRSFEALEPVFAKGYSEPVPIFVPSINTKWIDWEELRVGFVGREREMKEVMVLAKSTLKQQNSESSMMVISAEGGSGKSALLAQASKAVTDHCRAKEISVVVSELSLDEGAVLHAFSAIRKLLYDICVFPLVGPACDIGIAEEHIEDYVYGRTTADPPVALEKLMAICKEACVPKSYTSIICRLILTERKVEDWDRFKTSSIGTISRFLLRIFVRSTASCGLTILAIDNISSMDEQSWKVVELIYDHSPGTLILGSSLPVTSDHVNIDEEFWKRLKEGEESGRFCHIRLLPMHQSDIKRLVANKLGIEETEINPEMAREIFVKSGGIPWLALEILKNEYSRKDELESKPMPLDAVDGSEAKGEDNIGHHVLSQMDTLPSSVRTLLSVAALLGQTFHLLDLARIMEENNKIKPKDKPRHEKSVHKNLTTALDKGILIVKEEGNADKPLDQPNITYGFSHDLWRSSLLKLSLDEWKRKVQKIILESHGGDVDMLLKLLPLWTDHASIGERMGILLRICEKLALAGRNSLCIKFFLEELESLSLSRMEEEEEHSFNLVKLHIAMGRCYMSLLDFDASREAYLAGLKILEKSSRPSEDLLILRVVSGMFDIARVSPSDNFVFYRSLVLRFTNELVSEQHNEHFLRSLAMRTELMALKGQFEAAMDLSYEVREVYNASNYSWLLGQTYGVDHCCQCIAQSAIWSYYIDRKEEAASICDVVMETLLPSVDPLNLQNFFFMLYPVVLVLAHLNRVDEALDVFNEYVVKRTKDQLGEESDSPDRSAHEAILILLKLTKENCSVEDKAAATAWALEDTNGRFSEELDMFMAAAGRSAGSLTAEICLRLAETADLDAESKGKVVRKGLEMATKSRTLIGAAISKSPALYELEPVYEALAALTID